ncbi:MAG: type IV toxin-antitoxin system AbiEi family antitoxin [Gammaproteobacteria bacterium]|nr:type IV toxin-antitoxin system AbiEi family antitoxin [Gammaproteobacteria bacterium]
MSGQNEQKLKKLLSSWPKNAAVTSSWLTKNGFYRQLVNKYVNAGWLKREGRGIYSRLDDEVGWESLLYALQQEFDGSFHLGAYSALEYSGYAHFVRMTDFPTLFLFADNSKGRVKLPAWFKEAMQNRAEVVVVQRKLFSDNSFGLKDRMVSSVLLIMSIPERAILEMLALIPDKETFEQAHYVFQGLRQMRPQIVQEALEKCLSIKAKRLFLHFAEKNNFPLLKELNPSVINLGSGDRKIGTGGSYDTKYHLSVPIIREEENV